MPATVPQAVQSCHELLLWLIPQLDKFPRARRFTLEMKVGSDLVLCVVFADPIRDVPVAIAGLVNVSVAQSG